MSYTVFTDGCSNLPGDLIERFQIEVLPCSYVMDGEPGLYEGNIDAFDTHTYYEKLRNGSELKTSLLNVSVFLEHFRPVLEDGRDVIYVGMSSGVSGTVQSATIASRQLMSEFPERIIRVVDSLGAALGPGLLSCRAAELKAEGKSASEAADILDKEVTQLLQFFTVADLQFLKRTGRVSGPTAAIGTVLNIKPLLWGDPTGHIVAYSKCRGRQKAIDAIVEQYRTKAVNPQSQRIGITHGDCPEDAAYLAKRVREIAEPKELIIVPHEPFTGAHVGPGMLALYFFGETRE